jgi:hypothetical protein
LERANFDMEDNLGDDIGRAGSCCSSRELSNHSFHNFNHAYARELAYVVPIWPCPSGEAATWDARDALITDARKRGQMRRKGAYSEADKLTVARKIE